MNWILEMWYNLTATVGLGLFGIAVVFCCLDDTWLKSFFSTNNHKNHFLFFSFFSFFVLLCTFYTLYFHLSHVHTTFTPRSHLPFLITFTNFLFRSHTTCNRIACHRARNGCSCCKTLKHLLHTNISCITCFEYSKQHEHEDNGISPCQHRTPSSTDVSVFKIKFRCNWIRPTKNPIVDDT